MCVVYFTILLYRYYNGMLQKEYYIFVKTPDYKMVVDEVLETKRSGKLLVTNSAKVTNSTKVTNSAKVTANNSVKIETNSTKTEDLF